MIHVAICDDEKEFVSEMRGLIERYSEEKQNEIRISSFANGLELMEHYDKTIDLIFLDIQMKGMDGLKAAEKICQQDEEVGIIFLTSLKQYALEGYKYRAVNYIVKPMKYIRLKVELDRWIERFRNKNPHIVVTNDSGTFKVMLNTLHYVETYKRNLLLHTDDGEVISYKNMKELEKELVPYGFYRCHVADWTQEVILIDKSIICSFSFVRLLLGIGFYLYLRRYLREISEMMPDKIWKVLATILIMPLSSILGIVYFFPEGTVFLYPICIVTIITEFACIYLSAYICRKIVSENEARELRMKQVFYEERLKEEDRIRSIYHDLKNHLLILQSRVTNGEETQEMIQSLQKQISDYENYVETGNSFLDVIFRDKMKMAKEKNIDFHSEIDFSKGDFLDGLSVSTIFGNALDNAIEACEKISEEERFITVRGSVEQSFLAIQIENAACQNDCGQSVNTTKSDKFLHGFGKQNIQRAVEKYDGNVAWGYKDGIYTLSILIPLAK